MREETISEETIAEETMVVQKVEEERIAEEKKEKNIVIIEEEKGSENMSTFITLNSERYC